MSNATYARRPLYDVLRSYVRSEFAIWDWDHENRDRMVPYRGTADYLYIGTGTSTTGTSKYTNKYRFNGLSLFFLHVLL